MRNTSGLFRALMLSSSFRFAPYIDLRPNGARNQLTPRTQDNNMSKPATVAELYMTVCRAIERRERHKRKVQREIDGPINKLKDVAEKLILSEGSPLGFGHSISPEIQDLIDNPPSESGMI